MQLLNFDIIVLMFNMQGYIWKFISNIKNLDKINYILLVIDKNERRDLHFGTEGRSKEIDNSIKYE